MRLVSKGHQARSCCHHEAGRAICSWGVLDDVSSYCPGNGRVSCRRGTAKPDGPEYPRRAWLCDRRASYSVGWLTLTQDWGQLGWWPLCCVCGPASGFWLSGAGVSYGMRLSPKFWAVGKLLENLVVVWKFSFKMQKFGVYITHFGEIMGKVVHFSTYNLLCQKFVAVWLKIANFCPTYFLTHDAADLTSPPHHSCHLRTLHAV